MKVDGRAQAQIVREHGFPIHIYNSKKTIYYLDGDLYYVHEDNLSEAAKSLYKIDVIKKLVEDAEKYGQSSLDIPNMKLIMK